MYESISNKKNITWHYSDKYTMRTKRNAEEFRLTRITESINESHTDSNVYRTQLSHNPSKDTIAYVELVSPPPSIKKGYVTITSGEAIWELDLRNTRWGLELGPNQAIIESITLNIEIEDEDTEEIEEQTLEIPKGSIHWNKTEVTIGKFPLRLAHIIINMESSEEPSRWYYEIQVGDI